MSNVQYLNPKAEVLKKIQALAMNINAAMGLQDVMKSNLGPKGTLKMYLNIFKFLQACRRSWSNKAYQRWKCPITRNADSTPNSWNDCQISNSPR